jgi:hypothetical protein
MRFISVAQIPIGKKATYIRVVCAYRPEKEVPQRVRWTIGGDQIIYDGEVSTKTADLTTVKLFLNSIISTAKARCVIIDLADFFLGTIMPPKDYAYVRVPIHMIPDEVMIHYNLHGLVHKGHVYAEVRKGMYGLPQAGRLANDQLQRFLAPHGYRPCPITPGLWKHDTRPISFVLVVDDFAIKYVDRADADHLLDALKTAYRVKIDWDASRYCGLTLAWDYTNRTVDISMPGYIDRVLMRFQHPVPSVPEHSPFAWQQPVYGAKVQEYAEPPDASPALNVADQKRVQEVIGVLLYYARAVDCTLLTALSSLATDQAHGTEATMRALTQILNYCASHPSATVRFHASDMVLWAHSDASYLSVPKARSRAGGYFFLSSRPSSSPSHLDPPPPANGAVDILCHILRSVMSSAAEAELGALFLNAKQACPIRTTLEELGHPQPATPLQTDNSTAAGIANDTVKMKHSKAIDMRFYWVRDRVRKKQFHIFWKPAATNQADYFTKHHPASHHQTVRSQYLLSQSANYYAALADAPVPAPDDCCGEGVLMPDASYASASEFPQQSSSCDTSYPTTQTAIHSGH